MNVTEFKDRFVDGLYGDFRDYDEALNLIESFPTTIDDHIETDVAVYSVKDQEGYFKVIRSMWHGSYDQQNLIIEKVEPIIVKKTDWRVIE